MSSWSGAAWKQNVTHVHYIDNKIASRNEHFNDNNATAILTPEVADAKIVRMTAYQIKLWVNRGNSCFRKSLTHYYVKILTKNGFALTFEKGTNCILSQSALSSHMPPLERLKDGVERKRLDTMKVIIDDPQPKDKTVKDIIDWIYEGVELKEAYHILNSNCQQFVNNLWQRFSSKPFPNPAKIPETQPFLQEAPMTPSQERPPIPPRPPKPPRPPRKESTIPDALEMDAEIEMVEQTHALPTTSLPWDYFSLFLSSIVSFFTSIFGCSVLHGVFTLNLPYSIAVSSVLAIISSVFALVSQRPGAKRWCQKLTAKCSKSIFKKTSASSSSFAKVLFIVFFVFSIILPICFHFMSPIFSKRGKRIEHPLALCATGCFTPNDI